MILTSLLSMKTVLKVNLNLISRIIPLHPLRRFGGFIVNFEHISHFCSNVSIVNFEHVVAGWGVPKGSPLSPILFILYVSNIPHPLDAQVNPSKFADNIAIRAQAPRIRSITLRLQKCMNQILT